MANAREDGCSGRFSLRSKTRKVAPEDGFNFGKDITHARVASTPAPTTKRTPAHQNTQVESSSQFIVYDVPGSGDCGRLSLQPCPITVTHRGWCIKLDTTGQSNLLEKTTRVIAHMLGTGSEVQMALVRCGGVHPKETEPTAGSLLHFLFPKVKEHFLAALRCPQESLLLRHGMKCRDLPAPSTLGVCSSFQKVLLL